MAKTTTRAKARPPRRMSEEQANEQYRRNRDAIRGDLTQDHACALIDYIEALEARVNHQSIIDALAKEGYTEAELDEACKALGKVAHRTFSIL